MKRYKNSKQYFWSNDLPDEFYADFLRGYFDGDGTTYGYKDPRWKNSHMYYIGFVSASYDFLVWLQGKNRQLLRTTRGKIRPGTRAYTLTYAKSDSNLLFGAMYHGGVTHLLPRKFKKLEGFIKADPHGKITPVARVL